MKINLIFINNAQFKLLSKRRSSRKIMCKLLERHLFLGIEKHNFFNRIVGGYN